MARPARIAWRRNVKSKDASPERPVGTAVSYLQEAYETGKKNNCCPIDILVAVHSQGGEILDNAVRSLSPELQKTMRILGLNSENPQLQDGFGWVRNVTQMGWDVASSMGRLAPDRWRSEAVTIQVPWVTVHERAAFYPYLQWIADDFVPQR